MVSRGCPHACGFCYKPAFFEGGRSFYAQRVDAALAEIASLPGRHLYFLDDHLFGDPRFAEALFDGMRDMGRLWQAAGTVGSVLRPGLLEKAVACGLRSLFVGFETLDEAGLRSQHKRQRPAREYAAAIRRLHERHLAYSAGWKKAEPLWDLLIRLKQVGGALPLLERVLAASAPVREAGARRGPAPSPPEARGENRGLLPELAGGVGGPV